LDSPDRALRTAHLVNVSHLMVDAQPTAVIAETTSWEAYPELWPRLLDEVWSVVRPRRSEIAPGRNVMFYKDAVPNVEVGVEVAERATAPRLVLHELADQADRLARVPATAHLGLQCRPDGARNGQQAACLPLLVQPVHRRRLDIDLGVVPERLELRAGAEMD